MSKVNEEIRRRMLDAQRHPPVDGVFERLVRRKTRRERSRRLSTVISSVVLLAALGGGFLLAGRPQPRQAATSPRPRPSVIPPGAPGGVPYYIPAVRFAVCDVSSVGWPSPGESASVIMSLFARGSGPSCGSPPGGDVYLSLYTVGVSLPVKTRVTGPIACYQDCRAFGVPRIGRGVSVLAVVVADSWPDDTIALYRFDRDGRSPFSQVVTDVSGKREPVTLAWGGAGQHRDGATCRSGLLDVWSASRVGKRWHVLESLGRIHGTTLTNVRTLHSVVGRANRLPSGATDFCGYPVRP